MTNQLARNGKLNTFFLILVLSFILSLLFTAVQGLPAGPTITVLGNSTKATSAGTKINSTINASISPGGYIFTVSLDSQQQNTRWKAYVGNVTGTLTLDDANSNTIFQWSLSTVTGEVYATRGSSTINWSGINCTWRGERVPFYNESNRSVEELENIALSQTNKDDNITTSFRYANHSQIVVGSVIIPKNTCFAANTWQKSKAQSFADSDSANFTQVILYDGTNVSNGNIIYETKIENDMIGYRADSTYDFQILLPENGATGFSSSTAYYFYVELT